MSVIPIKIGNLEYLVAEGIGAPHCFTTRLGGVSTGIFDSLNLNFSRGDDPDRVVENFRRIGAVLGFTPEDVVNARQIHSDIVVRVDRNNRGKLAVAGASPECDALITNTPGMALYVSTADCTPILLWDSVTGAVGAAHAGWRGTVSAIGARTVEAMVREFGTKPENIRAAIGPSIGFCHFETDADVPEAVLAAFGEEAKPFIRQQGNKYYVNLKEVNALVLRRAGVRHIEISQACTMCQPDVFWSHRVTLGQRGAQGGIIVCKEVQP
jgi:YfiH family protein